MVLPTCQSVTHCPPSSLPTGKALSTSLTCPPRAPCQSPNWQGAHSIKRKAHPSMTLSDSTSHGVHFHQRCPVCGTLFEDEEGGSCPACERHKEVVDIWEQIKNAPLPYDPYPDPNFNSPPYCDPDSDPTGSGLQR